MRKVRVLSKHLAQLQYDSWDYFGYNFLTFCACTALTWDYLFFFLAIWRTSLLEGGNEEVMNCFFHCTRISAKKVIFGPHFVFALHLTFVLRQDPSFQAGCTSGCATGCKPHLFSRFGLRCRVFSPRVCARLKIAPAISSENGKHSLPIKNKSILFKSAAAKKMKQEKEGRRDAILPLLRSS